MGYQFFHLLLHIGKIAKDAGSNMVETTGITAGQAWLLDVVARFGPIKQAEAASVLNVRLPAVSRMAKGMERDGLILRERSGTDDRVVLLRLTEKGRSYIPEVREVWSRLEEKMMEGFSDNERARFKELMVKAAGNLS